MSTTNEKKAFTLMEILLSMGLVAMMMGISVPILQSFQYKNEVDTAVSLAARALRTAQINSQASFQDAQWGARFAASSITVFKGATYAGRDTVFDQQYPIDSNIAVSGVTEIVFTKMKGETTNVGTITLSQPGSARNITINAKGRLTY